MSSFVQECGASHQDPAYVQYARKISRLKADRPSVETGCMSASPTKDRYVNDDNWNNKRNDATNQTKP